MRKLAIVVESTSSGVGKHVLDIIDNLLSSYDEFQIVLIHSLVRADSIYLERLNLINSHRLRVIEIPMLRNIRILDIVSFFRIYFCLVRNGSFDVVHCHSSKAGALGSLAAYLLNCPKVLFSPHGLISSGKSGFAKKTFLLFEKACCFFSKIVVASSLEEFSYAKENFLSNGTCILYIPNGVEIPSEDKICAERLTFRNKFSISDSTLLISSIGRLTSQKNPMLFLETVLLRTKVCRDNNELFILVGDGVLSSSVDKFIEDNNLQKHILRLGFVDPISPIYSSSDIYILHSVYEGMPYTLLENMAYRKAVISTQVQSATELVSQPCHFVVESNPESINCAISALVDSGLREMVGNSNREKIRTYYSDTRMISSLAALYNS